MKRKQGEVEAESPEWMLAVGGWLTRVQEGLERFLRLRIVRIPLRVMHRIIMIYLIAGGIVFALLIDMSIEGKGKKPDFRSLTLPAMPGRGNAAGPKTELSFRHGLDSIQADEALQREFDSLMKARPGIADTIRRLEEMYPRK